MAARGVVWTGRGLCLPAATPALPGPGLSPGLRGVNSLTPVTWRESGLTRHSPYSSRAKFKC